ncbi:MAG: DUF2974 domain-containing protein [Clostridia bacterium]|nr:DUF2974 domain-containing protein [Clostridia bacterium]
MPGINDYLDWRGDIPANRDNINEVDNLILCMLAYVDFEDIIPNDPNAEGITLREAAKEYFFTHKENTPRPLGLIVPSEIVTLFRSLADLPRYRGIYLTGYVNEICLEREMQFSCLSFVFPDGTRFVAFRGTDDTIVGWKEDFKLGYMDEVPAQRKAVQYLDSLVIEEGTALFIGGHSKGGNLAVWGAVHASESVRRAICRVFSNDGPGFSEELINSEIYQSLSDRFTFLLPQSSLVGLLLSNDSTYQIVKSRALGVFQHNGLSWDVMGSSFVRMERLSGQGVRTDTVIRERIDSMNREEKRVLAEMFFEVLESTGATTLTELAGGHIKNAFSMLKTFQTFDKEKKEMAAYLVGKLFDVKLVSGSKEKEMAKEFSGEKLLGLREDAAEENLEAPHISEKRSSKARVRVELFPLLHCRIKG